ncbi:MAG: hypothetical protein ACI4DK_07165, partial [Lachnospiraceae bacterium]
MVKIDELETSGWNAAIRGMRNPLNSWAKSDSFICDEKHCKHHEGCDNNCDRPDMFVLGLNDLDLALRLIKAGPEHRKFLRMIHVQFDITGPMFWWAEYDTYKIATTRNSCSKMHKIHVKPFELDDFSHEGCNEVVYAGRHMMDTIEVCEQLRQDFNETKERKYWRALIELLPESYNMKATWDGSMETLLNACHQRDHHKLYEEWAPMREYLFENV